MVRILGISAFYHDSAAALLEDGQIVGAAQEERFTRVKGDASFPHRAIGWCLDQAGIGAEDVDHVVFYEQPVVKFEREYCRLGGAANVAQNLSALGARVSLVGIVGRDRTADLLRRELSSAGLDVSDLVEDDARPTVEKTRIVTDRHQHVARIDREVDVDIAGSVEQAVISRIRQTAARADAVLVPKKAVLYEGAQPVVFAVRDGKAVRIPIEEGYSDLERMEVRNVGEDGVRPDDRVVVAGGADLRDGASVLVVEG